MSKASFEIITSAKRESFLIRKFDEKGFTAPFHFHPEYELTCIIKGKGKRFVGNNMGGFDNTDIALLGSNLPHCWKLGSPDMKAESIVIQFNYNFLGDDFFSAPEMKQIKKLLKRSEVGIEFQGRIKDQIKTSMQLLLEEKDDFKRVISLLATLNKLSVSKEYVLLNKKNSIEDHSDDKRERINKVFAFIVENFHDEILLQDASSTIGMTPNAFCKFFKKMTRKTFMETVIDYRINFATQQLVETDKSVSDVCFESGFRDMSHFYKTFSSRMEMSPLNYRKQFLNETENQEMASK